MEIKLKSLKFDADQKLVDYVDKKVSRLERFFPAGAEQVAEVILSLGVNPENKEAKILVHIPGQELVIERQSTSFEQALTDAVDAMKEKLTRAKEKLYEK
ncbi:MAG: HPF/RaiA family ribosome-associated protein [Bacteroidales bacterium]|nr:HPF/RaiA family ribosome-associated protein [Bacteroidales bacterium]